MCLLHVSLGSRVSPSIFCLMLMGSVMLSICSSSCVLYAAGSGVAECMLWSCCFSFVLLLLSTCIVVSAMLVCLQFECFPIYVSVCFVCFMFELLVNCLLNAFAICVGVVNVFSLKVMVLFLGCVGFLLANPCIVFQRVCVLCL